MRDGNESEHYDVNENAFSGVKVQCLKSKAIGEMELHEFDGISGKT